ncbi:hypothetical protein WA026_021555, partial [Henosepilachna vigintioctopunctata]
IANILKKNEASNGQTNNYRELCNKKNHMKRNNERLEGLGLLVALEDGNTRVTPYTGHYEP